MMSKVQEHHLARPAYIYVRQSTPGQILHHQESTARQYALRDKAEQMQWGAATIQILDQDLGQSGQHTTGREDFRRLVSDVSMGRVGAIFALEASRLARSDLDWHRLIEICSITNTLVVDEDGCYDPGDFNDALLLGLKATIAKAELHFIRARLQGGKLNKAKRGELRFPLPVGFCYDEAGQIVLDPDQQVQGAVRLVFHLFHELGSAYGVVQHFAQKQLQFPKRAYGGAWNGKLIWGRLGHGRVISLLKNPSYTGMYSFGRFRSCKQISADGEIHNKVERAPMDSWQVKLQDHHPGYITWEQFERNQKLLSKNRTNGEETLLSGPAREGLALLQGLLLCAQCGRRVSVRYQGNGGIYPTYDCNRLRREGLSSKSCLNVRCDLLDVPVCRRVLELLKPAQLQIATEAMRQLEHREAAVNRQWQMRIERATYEAELAERRYEEVDPSNRLVASTLEKRWNDALVKVNELKAEHTGLLKKEALSITAEQREKVMRLAADFPRLWNAPTTKAKDKKRMLRLLIKDITVERIGEQRLVILHVRWQGGACEDIRVNLPPKAADVVRYPGETVERVRELARDHSDDQLAKVLNQEGRRPTKGDTFTVAIVRWIRYKHRIAAPVLKRAEEHTVKELAQRLNVSTHVVYYWLERGVIEGRRLNGGAPYWITLSPKKECELRARVRDSTKLQKRRKRA
jgi:DNA invertase Pin-like site-specific DNA recombinase